MKKLKVVYSLNTQLYKVTGVEKVMMDVHHALLDTYDCKIVGTISYDQVRPDHHIKKEEYIKWRNPFMFRNSIVIVHERKLLILFWLLNNLLFQNIKIVYVHHNIFHDHKRSTILPKTIVAIADKGIENLTEFFCAPKEHIHKIYNCVKDEYKAPHPTMHRDQITLLLPGRINGQKQQVEIVRQLAGNLDPRIKILFAGDGPLLEDLKVACEGNKSFEVLGFRSDVKQLLSEVDFMLLYSMHEGLPITLIEATMIGMPIICSDVGGNAEICHQGENGWVLHDWDELVKTLNNLPNVTDEQYAKMCEESRKIYESNFTFEIFKKQYTDLISKL